MVDLRDYLPGGDKHGQDPESEPMPARSGPFSVGDYVIVDHVPGGYSEYDGTPIVIEFVSEGGAYPYRATFPRGSLWFSASRLANDAAFHDEEDEDGEVAVPGNWRPTVGDLVIIREHDGIEDHDLPQVVCIKQDDRDSTPYLADFVSGEEEWFDEESCEPYEGERTDAPFLLDGPPRQGARPKVGDLVIVHKIDGVTTERLPQVVEIERDDHSSLPFFARFVDDHWWFEDKECEPYTGDRTDTPFLMPGATAPDSDDEHCEDDDDENEGWEPKYEVGQKVTADAEYPETAGLIGEIIRVDEDDPDTPYYVQWGDEHHWVTEPGIRLVDDDEAWRIERERLWQTYAAARFALINHLGADGSARSWPYQLLKKNGGNKLNAIKDLRLLTGDSLKEAKAAIDVAADQIRDEEE